MSDPYAQTAMADEDAIAALTVNPVRKCPVAVLADTSASMKGNRISQLNAGIAALMNGISRDAYALKSIELCIVSFGKDGVQVVQDFATVDHVPPIHLEAGGSTPMGEAITTALDRLVKRQKLYRAAGHNPFRGNIIIISDGAPDSGWQEPAKKLGAMHNSRQVFVVPVGVEKADFGMLNSICSERAREIGESDIPKLFQYVSDSLRNIPNSTPGNEPGLDTGPY